MQVGFVIDRLYGEKAETIWSAAICQFSVGLFKQSPNIFHVAKFKNIYILTIQVMLLYSSIIVC